MQAGKKMRRGAAVTVFLSGLLLEGVVLLAAFWSTVSVWVADELGALADPAVVSSAEPDRVAPAGATPAAGGMQAIQRQVDEGLPELATVCWNNFRTGTAAETVGFELSVAKDGTVDTIRVDTRNAALKACLEAEIGMWTFPAPGRTMSVRYRLPFH